MISGGVDHTGAVVIPALGALAQFLLGLTGKAFLESMIIGYEVGRRVLDACGGYRPHNHEDGFHSTGTIGSFAAAAAAARAMNLDEDQTVWAMGLAGSFTGGTWAFARDGAMGKRFHAGWAAETGVTAAVLASQGFTGPEFIFEAEWGGFFSTYARSASCPEKLVQDLGTTFAIMRTGIKPYAACRDIHSSLDVVLRARDKHRLLPEDIQEILVRATPETFQMVGQNPYPETRPQAQLSLSYSLAAAMVTGRAFVEEFEEAMIENFDVQEMAMRAGH
ncbi:MAG: MmgE/PrpD family protein [Desulfobacter sp.]|nr:MmgE/PrpD family protein [Desulfobacter sp.]